MSQLEPKIDNTQITAPKGLVPGPGYSSLPENSGADDKILGRCDVLPTEDGMTCPATLPTIQVLLLLVASINSLWRWSPESQAICPKQRNARPQTSVLVAATATTARSATTLTNVLPTFYHGCYKHQNDCRYNLVSH